MRLRKYVLCFWLCTPLLGHAQTSEDERGVALYLESIVMSMSAPVCEARIAGFVAKFAPPFERWKKLNSAELKKGEEFLRAAATEQKMDFSFHVGAVADTAVRVLEKSSLPILERNCNVHLQRVGVQ